MVPATPPGIFPKGEKVAGRLRGGGYQPKASNKQTNSVKKTSESLIHKVTSQLQFSIFFNKPYIFKKMGCIDLIWLTIHEKNMTLIFLHFYMCFFKKNSPTEHVFSQHNSA